MQTTKTDEAKNQVSNMKDWTWRSVFSINPDQVAKEYLETATKDTLFWLYGIDPDFESPAPIEERRKMNLSFMSDLVKGLLGLS
jgi:hypothetical protein